MTHILFFGECMLEESDDDDLHFGGDSLNSALYLARTAQRELLQVSYATALGIDDNSERLLKAWQIEGINTKLVTQIKSKCPGRYRINTNALGERSFVYERDHSAAKYYLQNPHQLFCETLTEKKCDYFYFSGISLAILSIDDRDYLFKCLTAYKRAGGKVIFDNNYREILWQGELALPYYQQAMQLADIAFLTDEDEYALYGETCVDDILKRIQAWKVPEVVIKQGEKPCLVFQNKLQKSGEPYYVDSIASIALSANNIIDTCAAGDAFAAGYLAKRLTAHNIREAAQFAHQLAGRVIQFSGAIIPQSSMADLIAD
ncbi:MAG: 2-dehydro-3-deoxygluconokinase [Alteromonadaceae bacterium]|jgi:2-dehydro-3-deoxygluconokinase